MKHLILINGLKRSGKDFTAQLMSEIIPNIGSISYASPIKEIIADTFEISLEELEEYKNNSELLYLNNGERFEEISNFRTILQRFGTEAMKKQFGENVWAKRGIDAALELGNDIVVIPDFRFIIESEEAFKAASKYNFTVSTIHIFNDNLPTADLHASERDLSDNNFKFDYEIDNTGQPDISIKVKEIVSKILE